MNRRIKGIFAAVTATAICSLNTAALAANSGTSDVENIVYAAGTEAAGHELIRENGIGVRDGYCYRRTGCSENDEMELISPSLFRAKWDSTDAANTRTPVFERGKQFDPGQELSYTMESAVDYEMKFEAEGSFFAGVHITLNGPETEQYCQNAEIYIIDASLNWKVPGDASYLHSITGKGTLYSVYHCNRRIGGTGKGLSEDSYYIVDKYAESCGKAGKVSARHDIAAFIDGVILYGDYVSNSVSVGINGGVSKGSAELVRNEITVPDTPKFEDPHDYISKRIYLDNGSHWDNAAQTRVGGKTYSAFGYDIEMKGYAGEPVSCTWNYYKDTEEYERSGFRKVSFGVPDSFYTLSIIDWQGSSVYDDVDDLVLGYSMDIGAIENKTGDSSWNIGADIQCMKVGPEPRTGLAAELLGNESITYVHVIDKAENFSLASDMDRYYAPEELGTITSGGIDYDVVLYKNKSESAFPSINLIRREQISPTAAEDIPEGYVRYENSFSLVDIVNKLNDLGLDIGGIRETEFLFNTYDTSGHAYLNYAGIKRVIPPDKTYTEDDVKLLKSYLLGQAHEAPECSDYASHDYYEMDLEEYLSRMKKNYDLNGDGVWDTFDLCLMQKKLVSKSSAELVEPDNRIEYGTTYDIIGNGLKLYSGPGESYEVIGSVPPWTQLKELGYQSENSTWIFTEYSGQYGWADTSEPNISPYMGEQWGKPVIYLYPEKETDVHVELELTFSDLYTTYPRYNNGWDVTAYPDGSLLNKADGTHHKYLFWESVNARTRFDFSKGFCVAGKDTESFLKEKLTYMGLTEEEMNEFIVYWLPKMEHNAYNLITFQGDLYTEAAKLTITPTPDSLLRIFMAYVPLEAAADIEPQQLEAFERKGFTVVEWGGTEIR